MQSYVLECMPAALGGWPDISVYDIISSLVPAVYAAVCPAFLTHSNSLAVDYAVHIVHFYNEVCSAEWKATSCASTERRACSIAKHSNAQQSTAQHRARERGATANVSVVLELDRIDNPSVDRLPIFASEAPQAVEVEDAASE